MPPTTPLKTALLIIDMQNFFLPMTTTCLPNIIKLSRHFASKGWPQYFTQHGHPNEDFEEPVTNQLVRKWGKDGSLRVGTGEWELIGDVGGLVEAGAFFVSVRSGYSLGTQTTGIIILKKT